MATATATAQAPQAERELCIHLRTLHTKQRQFVECPAKRIVICAGRRGGKTVGISQRAVRRFLDGRRVLYGAPTQEQVTAFWTECKWMLHEMLAAKVMVKNETLHTIEWLGYPGRIRAKTAWDADSYRGDYADDLIYDEFQLMEESAWEEVGAPMLLDNDGDAVFIFTPPSLRNVDKSRAKDKRYATRLFKRAEANTTGRWKTFHFTSHDNPFISKTALSEIISDMTARAHRQEIMAELDTDNPAALWKRDQLDDDRVSGFPELRRIVVAVDPSETAGGDEAGIVTCGVGMNGHYYLLADDSLQASPDMWAKAAIAAYHKHAADRMVYEANAGGDMVRITLGTVDKSIPLREIHAKRAKLVRAEPIAALCEQHRVHHVGFYPDLEDELCNYSGAPGQASPNRLDAYVYALLELHGQPDIPGGFDRKQVRI